MEEKSEGLEPTYIKTLLRKKLTAKVNIEYEHAKSASEHLASTGTVQSCETKIPSNKVDFSNVIESLSCSQNSQLQQKSMSKSSKRLGSMNFREKENTPPQVRDCDSAAVL